MHMVRMIAVLLSSLQLVVTGMDINVIYKNCQLRLLDVVTEVDGKPASVQQFEKMRMDKKCSSKLTIVRNPLHTLSCADIGENCKQHLSHALVDCVLSFCRCEGLEWGQKEGDKAVCLPHGHPAPLFSEEGRNPGRHSGC